MSKKSKIIVYIALGIALIVFGKFLYKQLEDYCPRCRKPGFSNTVSEITKDYVNLKIVYSKNNGSLPPPYYREDMYIITTDEKGSIIGEHSVRGYDEVKEKKALDLSREQLTKLITAAEKINPESNDSINSGCTGGTGKSIEISQNKKVLLKTSAYNCAGRSTNMDLETFSIEAERLLLPKR